MLNNVLAVAMVGAFVLMMVAIAVFILRDPPCPDCHRRQHHPNCRWRDL